MLNVLQAQPSPSQATCCSAAYSAGAERASNAVATSLAPATPPSATLAAATLAAAALAKATLAAAALAPPTRHSSIQHIR